MYHTSAKLTFGGGEKIVGGTKSTRERQKASEAYKKNGKNSGDLFFLGDSKKKLYFVGAPNGKHG